MRVSCFFVSVAIIFAQQASAAPILGLPNLPLIGNESGVVPRVSNTLEFVPLLEPLIGNARESTSNHGLLSGTELLGTHLLNRRENQELLSSLAPVTDSITNMPLLNSVAPLNPTVHGLVSGVEQQDARASILSGVTNNLSIDLPLHILKRAAGIPFLSAIPGLDMLSSSSESTQASSIPDVSAIPSLGSIPGMSAVGALTSALPMGGLARRDGTLAALPLIGSLPGIGAITSLPGLSSIPSMPSGLSIPGHSTASSLLTSVSSLTGSLI